MDREAPAQDNAPQLRRAQVTALQRNLQGKKQISHVQQEQDPSLGAQDQVEQVPEDTPSTHTPALTPNEVQEEVPAETTQADPAQNSDSNQTTAQELLQQAKEGDAHSADAAGQEPVEVSNPPSPLPTIIRSKKFGETT